MKFLFALLIAPAMALGDCPNAVYLNIGDKVLDCPRIGLSEPYDVQVRADLVKGDYNSKLVTQYEGLLKIKDQILESKDKQITLFRTEVDRSYLALDQERSRTKTDFWVGLAAGIGIILISAVVIEKVVR